jgi:hypothetical protein
MNDKREARGKNGKKDDDLRSDTGAIIKAFTPSSKNIH